MTYNQALILITKFSVSYAGAVYITHQIAINRWLAGEIVIWAITGLLLSCLQVGRFGRINL
jgi:hypothetical protein